MPFFFFFLPFEAELLTGVEFGRRGLSWEQRPEKEKSLYLSLTLGCDSWNWLPRTYGTVRRQNKNKNKDTHHSYEDRNQGEADPEEDLGQLCLPEIVLGMNQEITIAEKLLVRAPEEIP